MDRSAKCDGPMGIFTENLTAISLGAGVGAAGLSLSAGNYDPMALLVSGGVVGGGVFLAGNYAKCKVCAKQDDILACIMQSGANNAIDTAAALAAALADSVVPGSGKYIKMGGDGLKIWARDASPIGIAYDSAKAAIEGGKCLVKGDFKCAGNAALDPIKNRAEDAYKLGEKALDKVGLTKPLKSAEKTIAKGATQTAHKIADGAKDAAHATQVVANKVVNGAIGGAVSGAKGAVSSIGKAFGFGKHHKPAPTWTVHVQKGSMSAQDKLMGRLKYSIIYIDDLTAAQAQTSNFNRIDAEVSRGERLTDYDAKVWPTVKAAWQKAQQQKADFKKIQDGAWAADAYLEKNKVGIKIDLSGLGLTQKFLDDTAKLARARHKAGQY